jgi:hypothetical protein
MELWVYDAWLGGLGFLCALLQRLERRKAGRLKGHDFLRKALLIELHMAEGIAPFIGNLFGTTNGRSKGSAGWP